MNHKYSVQVFDSNGVLLHDTQTESFGRVCTLVLDYTTSGNYVTVKIVEVPHD